MTDSAIAHTHLPKSDDAGTALGKLIASTFKGERPDALILFASPTYDYPTLLQALDRACGPKIMVGCSSSGEFSTHLASLNAVPAVEVFAEHAETTGQPFEVADPLPFFLHNIIGIDTGHGHKLRVPLAAHPDGSISCAAEVPLGATAHIMGTTSRSAAEAAARATRAACAQLQGQRPAVALFFDCAATRLRTGKEFGLELRSLEGALGPAPYAGCNTFGQIARAEGQFSGFHNCTAVVCVIPE